MRLFQKLKHFIRRIFVDYNYMNHMIEENSQRYLGQVSQINDSIENKLKIINDKIDEVNHNIKSYRIYETKFEENNRIINDKLQEINKILSQFKYSNTELQNIKISKEKKNVLIIGFYGAPNLGDELMLETLLQYIDNNSNIQITVLLADNPKYNIDKYKDIRFIHYPKTLYDFNILAEQYDYFVFGGGAIIDDKQFEKEDSYQYDLGTILLKLSIRAIAFNKKVIGLGLSATKEISNPQYLENLKYVVENSYYFSVRDIYTKNYLSKKLGMACGEKIINISDIVLANKDIFENVQNNKQTVSDKLNIGIAWISNDYNLENLEKVLRDIEKYAEKLQLKECNINFIPFYEYNNIDTNFYRDIMQKEYKNLKINIEEYPINMNRTIELYQKNDIIIGVRYHSILIAHALNIPCIAICYDIHEHYIYKIKHLSEIFEQGEAISYKNIQENMIYNKLIEFNGKVNENNQKKVIEIELVAQEQIARAIDKIFN